MRELRLKFFGVDTAGNQETVVQTEIYTVDTTRHQQSLQLLHQSSQMTKKAFMFIQ